MRQREREYEEKKQLDALKFERMTAEMEKVVTELKEEKSRGDRAREARRIQRNEETAKRDNARKVREMKRKEAVASREQDENKEKIQMQPDVKDEILMDQKIGFNTTSDELHRSQFPTPIPIPHADDVEVPGICIAEFHCGIPPLETCSITSASTPPHVATVNIVSSTVEEELQTACSEEPYCDVTRIEATPSLVHEAPVLIVYEHLLLPETLIVKDEKDFNSFQDEIQLSALCDEQTGLYTQTCHQFDNHQVFERCSTEVHGFELNHDDTSLCKAACQPQSTDHRCDNYRESVRCSAEIFGAGSNSDNTTLCHVDTPQKIAHSIEQVAPPATPDVPESHDVTVCLADDSQEKAIESEQVATSAMPYLFEPHADHTVQVVMFRFLYYCYASTLVSKIFYCVSLCLLYVMYCSIVLRYCTYLSACSV